MSKKTLYIVIAVVVVVLGGVAAYAFINNNNKTEIKDSDTSKTETKDAAVAKKYTDACKLFTKDEIGAALGGTFGDGEEEIAFSTATPGTPEYGNEDLEGTACKYDQEDDGTTTGMQQSLRLSIEVKTYVSVSAAEAAMTEFRTTNSIDDEEVTRTGNVAGVGDEAFSLKLVTDTSVADKNAGLYVRDGRQIIVFTSTRLTGVNTTDNANLVTLAKKL